MLPEIVIEERSAQPEKALRPPLRYGMECVQFQQVVHYDEQGNRSAEGGDTGRSPTISRRR